MTIINRPSTRQGTERPLPPQPTVTSQNNLLRWTMLIFVVGYWLFAWYLERVDLIANPPKLWTLVMPIPLPGVLATLFEFFHWRVLRHFIPLIVGGWLAYQAAVSLVWMLYDLPDREGASRFLRRLRTGLWTGPPLALDRPTLDTNREQHVILRIGGPGFIAIKRGEVAVTEVNGRFYRIRKNGVHRLDRFENVYTVLDLHPQERSAERVQLVTKDGIPFTATVRVHFRISTGGTPVTSSQPFPFDETAVLTAAYTETVLADSSKSTWDAIPVGKASGNLRKRIAQHSLDDILASDNPGTDPLLIIRDAVERETRTALRNVGVELLSLHIGQLTFPKAVTDQYVQYWQSHSEAQIRVSQAHGQANALKEVEIARAEAEVIMIKAILEGVERARLTTQSSSMREVVAMRMVEALEKMARQSQQIQPIPTQLLSQLGMLRHQLEPGSSKTQSEEGNERS